MPLLLLGVLLFGVGIGNVTSMPPLIAQVEFVKEDVPRVVALVVAIGQATYAFAPAVFGLVRELSRRRRCLCRRRAGLYACDRRSASGASRLDKIRARVALQIEQRREVAVVDARVRGFARPSAWRDRRRRGRPLRSSRGRWRRRRPRACRAARGRGARAIRSSVASFASRPRIGSATRPASLPSSTISVLPRCSSKPIIAATRPVNSVKPPETRQV